jgi:hypothetical protein
MDNRSAVVGIGIGALLAVLLIGGGYLASRLFFTAVDHEVQQQVRQAVAPGSQPAVRQAVDDAGRKAAKEISNKLLSEAKKPEKPEKPETHEDAKSTLEVSEEAPVTVDREAFSITLPPGSTIDPADPGLGSERLVHAKLPDHGTITFVMIEDKSKAKDSLEDSLKAIRLKADRTKDVTPEVMGLEYWSSAVAATVKDKPFIFEAGEREGTDKACLIVLEYPATPEDARKQTVAQFRKTLLTLKMKQ